MQQLSITRTRDFITLKIPVKPLGRGDFSGTSKKEELVCEGLKAVEEGRVSKKFKNSREAVNYPRNLTRRGYPQPLLT